MNKPFFLKPAGKDYLWGGQRLNDDFSKEIDLDPLAETWECSTHPDGQSLVNSGEFQGIELGDVLEEHPEFLGTHPQGIIKDGLPVLIKFIDANKDLSVQVHPSDEYAFTNENGQLGKSEMWYVIDADPGSKLVYGFRRKVTRRQVRDSIEDGNIEKYLQYVPVHRGDVFFIKAGTVHAIGGGILLAEIQESSNLTYRLYDYNRIGKDGKKRELHIQKALDVVNLENSAEPRQPIRTLKYKPGYASELIGRCKYFEVERVLINTERVRNMAEIQTGDDSFNALLCIDGCADLFGDDTLIHIFKGDCIFIPANSVPLKLHGKAEFLKVRC
jgi:mannose-6-phosphate isomerase class I